MPPLRSSPTCATSAHAARRRAQVEVSPCQGKGFPLERVPPADFPEMLIFATGSGIAPIKALIEAGALGATERKRVRLYYGAHDNDNMAYKERCGTACPALLMRPQGPPGYGQLREARSRRWRDPELMQQAAAAA